MHLRELCEKYNIRFKKQLGQNLLLDENINRILVEAALLTPEDDVVEVGAGLGALTDHIRRYVRRVLAIEIDRTFMPCLEDRFNEDEHVKLFRGDVLNHRVDKLLEEFLPGGTRYKMVSNLPYYITTPVLFHFWDSAVPFPVMVVMVQEEVAMRLVAQVDTSEYGVLSVAAQVRGDVEIVHPVPRTCFRPQPKVDSSIVRLRSRPEPRYPDLDLRFLSKVVRSAFSQRRKTLRNALTKSGAFGAPKEAVLEAFEAVGIDPQRRAQTVSVDEFVHLAKAIKERIPAQK